MAKKIKPLSKRRPLRLWIQRLFGRSLRSWTFGQLDEMHEYPTMLYETEEEKQEAEHPWPKVDPRIMGGERRVKNG